MYYTSIQGHGKSCVYIHEMETYIKCMPMETNSHATTFVNALLLATSLGIITQVVLIIGQVIGAKVHVNQHCCPFNTKFLLKCCNFFTTMSSNLASCNVRMNHHIGNKIDSCAPSSSLTTHLLLHMFTKLL